MTDPAAATSVCREPASTEERLRAMVEASGAALLVLDAGGVVVEASNAAASLLGSSPAALAGRPMGDLAPEWAGAQQAAIGGGGRWRGVFEVRGSGDSPALAAGVEVAAIGGDLARGFVVAFREPGGAAGAAAGDAIARAVHDLRNPLTALRGQAQLLKRRIARGCEADPARMLAGLDAIEEAADRMAALIDDLAAQAPAGAGVPPPDREDPGGGES